jgi:hypothetical protein
MTQTTPVGHAAAPAVVILSHHPTPATIATHISSLKLTVLPPTPAMVRTLLQPDFSDAGHVMHAAMAAACSFPVNNYRNY